MISQRSLHRAPPAGAGGSQHVPGSPCRQVLVADAPGEHLPARVPLQQLGGNPADMPDHIIGVCRCEHRLCELEHADQRRPSLELAQRRLGPRRVEDRCDERPGPPVITERLRRADQPSRGHAPAEGNQERGRVIPALQVKGQPAARHIKATSPHACGQVVQRLGTCAARHGQCPWRRRWSCWHSQLSAPLTETGSQPWRLGLADDIRQPVARLDAVGRSSPARSPACGPEPYAALARGLGRRRRRRLGFRQVDLDERKASRFLSCAGRPGGRLLCLHRHPLVVEGA